MYGHEETHEWIFSHFVQMCAIQIEVNDFDHYNDTEGYLPAFFDDIDNRRIMYSMSDGMLIDRDKWSPLAFF
jgi:hypothetical protein